MARGLGRIAGREEAPHFYHSKKIAHPHTGDLAICRRALPRLPYCEEEEREQIEHICEGGIQTIVVDGMIIPDFV